jgi:hypothetical protein
MTSGFQAKRRFTCVAFIVFGLAIFAPLVFVNHPQAQVSKPVLISQETSTRAISFDSVTRTHEPFATTSEVSWGNDNRTRVMLFAMGLNLQPNETATDVTAEAEDGAHKTYPLAVEYVGPVPDQPWATSIIVRLDDQLSNVGDVLVGITFRSVRSNRVRLAIGHVGDGPPDDVGAVPTPGSISAPPPASATAGTLTTSDVMTIISQAVSAAASLSHPVTVA